jgi:hypothetical protein
MRYRVMWLIVGIIGTVVVGMSALLAAVQT